MQQEPRSSSTPKDSGKFDFCFPNIKQVWKAYELLKMGNAFESALRQCLKDNNFRSEEKLVRCYTRLFPNSISQSKVLSVKAK